MQFGKRRGSKVGRQSETLVRDTLQKLKDSGKISDFEEVDEPGRDFIILLLDGSNFDLEVKSSYKRAKAHKKKYKTPVVVTRNPWSKLSEPERELFIESIEKNILKLLP